MPLLFEEASFDVVSDIHAEKMVTFNYGYTINHNIHPRSEAKHKSNNFDLPVKLAGLRLNR